MKIYGYQPLPKQLKFHKSKAKYKAFIGGWGSGKTKAGIWECIDLAMRFPKNCILVARKYSTDLRDTTQRMFFEECPNELIKEYKKSERRLIFINGSEILFRGLEYKSEREKRALLGSFNLGAFYVDEASDIDLSLFRDLQGRLRLRIVSEHYGLITSNPTTVEHWIYKIFVVNNDPNYFLVKSSSLDNIYLPKEYLEELQKYPESWKRRYLMGEFGFLEDGTPVFKDFNENLHISDDVNYMPGKPIIRGWDFGFHRPAVVWCQIDEDDRFIILKEYLGKDEYLDTFADKIIKISNEEFYNAEFIDCVDPAGAHISDKSRITSCDILRAKGINPRYKWIKVEIGIQLIQKKLNTLVNGRPAFIIKKSGCPRLIEAFAGAYTYTKDENKEIPYKDGFYEHLIDALRYIFNVYYNTTLYDTQYYDLEIPEPKWFNI